MLLLNLASVGFTSFPSGRLYNDGLRFYQNHANDSVFRIAIINELGRAMPPELPGFLGASFEGYYYFPYITVLIFKDFGIDVFDLFFRFFPTMLFLLLTLVIFVSMSYLTKREEIGLISVFLFFFAGDFSFIPELILMFKNPQYVYHYWNAIFATPTVTALHWNFPTLFSLIIFFAGLFALKLYIEQKVNFILPSIFFGFLVEFKAFFFIVVIISLFASGLIYYLIKKKSNLLKVFLASAVISSPLILTRLGLSRGSLFKFSFAYFPLKTFETFNIAVQNKVLLYISAIIIFLIGYLGIKIIALPLVFRLGYRFRKLNQHFLFLTTAFFVSFFLGFFVILNNENLVTSAFITFSEYLLTIFASIYIYNLIINKRLKFFAVAVIIILAIIAPLHFIIFSGLDNPGYGVISKNEYDAMVYLRENSSGDSVILHNFRDVTYKNDPTVYLRTTIPDNYIFINAVADRRDVIAGHRYAQIWLVPEQEIEQRGNEVNLFFMTDSPEKAREILKKYGVNYVYTLKLQKLNSNVLNLLETFYENDEVVIYKVK